MDPSNEHGHATPDRRRRARAVLAGAALVALAACNGSDEPRSCPAARDGGPLNPGFVIDRHVQNLVTFFQISTVADRTKTGQVVTCSDIPGTYRMNNPSLSILSTVRHDRKKSGAEPEVITTLKLPTNKKFLLIIEGFSQIGGGTHVVARGCSGAHQLAQCASPRPRLEVNVVATSGLGCNMDSECEPKMKCLKGQYLNGGYCAQVGCSGGGGGPCPPGSACVPTTSTPLAGWNGVCARTCTDIRDCIATGSQPQHDCICRSALTTSGQAMICGNAQWLSAMACGGVSDGGS